MNLFISIFIKGTILVFYGLSPTAESRKIAAKELNYQYNNLQSKTDKQ